MADDASFKILYFAAASTMTKKQSETFKAPLNVKQLFKQLETQYPGITEKVLNSSAITVNLNYIDLEDQDGADLEIRSGDEVAIIPPVSSG
jgi:molybdopterin converting factor small subunit